MSIKMHVKGMDPTKTKGDAELGLRTAATTAPPDGAGCDPTKMEEIAVPPDAAGKCRGFGFVTASDAETAAKFKTLSGRVIPALGPGPLTITDARPERERDDDRGGRDRDDRRGGRDRDDERPRREPPAAAPPTPPAPPATPARRTPTPRTTPPATRGSNLDGCWKMLIGLGVLLGVAGIILAIVLRNAVDPEARQMARTADTKADQAITGLTALRSDMNDVKGGIAEIQEILKSGRQAQPPAPAPAPAPVPPAPAPTPDQVGHHPVDGGHHGGGTQSVGRTRLDDHDDAIAELRAKDAEQDRQIAELQVHDREHTRVETVLANFDGAHACRGPHDQTGCAYLVEQLGRQFQ
jgi:hypothetical protein